MWAAEITTFVRDSGLCSGMNMYEMDLPPMQPAMPQGFVYKPDLVSEVEERQLVEQIRELPLKELEFHGYTARRRTMSFGWHYDFGRSRLDGADAIPAWLLPLRAAAADLAGLAPEQLPHALVLEYGPGSTIGWHRDKPVFGDVIGISLLSPCRFRLRRKAGARWERAALTLEPRSGYVLRGPSRTEWEHSIPAVDTLRYSITFRSLAARPPAGQR
ncbi:MAG TPA: alpha-ketoglutarate-dependent dioxygenase AlkB [Gemmatimonadales bacterium]|nr:alpha-ketoglutarate-dependent dioxygenase AlkB [Gemmatimonadales bacterium]